MDGLKKYERGAAATPSCPAGGAYGTDPQISAAAVGVVLETDRDRNTYRWLIAKYGEDAIKRAIAGLLGARKPYVSNIVKALGAKVPFQIEHPVSDDTKQKLRALREKLAAKNHQ